MKSRPPSKVFSTTTPTPTTRDCAPSTIRASARSVLPGRQKVVDDQHVLVRRHELRRHQQVDLAAFGVAGRGFQKDRPEHRDRLGLARVDNRHAQRQPGHQRRGDAGNLRRQDAVDLHPLEARRHLLPHFHHQVRVNLVVEDAVDLENPAAQVAPLGKNTLFQSFHLGADLRLCACFFVDFGEIHLKCACRKAARQVRRPLPARPAI